MNDSSLVGVLHCFADTDNQLESLADRQFLLRGIVVKWPTVDQFHREKRLWSNFGLSCSGLKHLRDAGVLQSSQHFDLVLEAAQELRVKHTLRQHLQRHDAARPLLLGAVDDAHPALADDSKDSVRADLSR